MSFIKRHGFDVKDLILAAFVVCATVAIFIIESL